MKKALLILAALMTAVIAQGQSKLQFMEMQVGPSISFLYSPARAELYNRSSLWGYSANYYIGFGHTEHASMGLTLNMNASGYYNQQGPLKREDYGLWGLGVFVRDYVELLPRLRAYSHAEVGLVLGTYSWTYRADLYKEDGISFGFQCALGLGVEIPLNEGSYAGLQYNLRIGSMLANSSNLFGHYGVEFATGVFSNGDILFTLGWRR